MKRTIFEEHPGMRVLQLRTGEFKTREDSEEMTIEGYFAVFNSNYEIWEGASESIAEGAFDSSLSGDVRGLTNHDTTLVLGRTKAHTLELKTDSHGLWGKITINPKDSDAVNTYERVKRGDVVRSEETDFNANGDIHWTITDVELFEVSVCTFPAYEETSISARHKSADELQKRAAEAWKLKMKERLNKTNKED